MLLNGKDCGFMFQGATGTVLATWAPPGAADQVKFGQAVQVVNPLTGEITKADTYELTTAPILGLGVPANLVAQAQANRSKPFLWGWRLYECGICFRNQEWHTVTWKITDAQFVSYWGFNFSLNSDGSKLNKYYIQSVTVTKPAN